MNLSFCSLPEFSLVFYCKMSFSFCCVLSQIQTHWEKAKRCLEIIMGGEHSSSVYRVETQQLMTSLHFYTATFFRVFWDWLREFEVWQFICFAPIWTRKEHKPNSNHNSRKKFKRFHNLIPQSYFLLWLSSPDAFHFQVFRKTPEMEKCNRHSIGLISLRLPMDYLLKGIYVRKGKSLSCFARVISIKIIIFSFSRAFFSGLIWN